MTKHDSWCPFHEVHSVYRILAGILNIGNIEFAAISSQYKFDTVSIKYCQFLHNLENTSA